MTNQKTRISIDLPGFLTVLFVVLKLLGIINWSWWWVFAPAWIPLLLGVLTVGLYFLGFFLWRLVRHGK